MRHMSAIRRSAEVALRSIVLMALCGSASAQIPNAQRTEGMLNCRYWNTNSDGSKLDFLIGFWDGYVLAGSRHPEDFIKLPEATYGEISRGVSQLCEKPENSRIPIFDAIYAFGLQLSGQSTAIVEKFLETMRREAANPAPK